MWRVGSFLTITVSAPTFFLLFWASLFFDLTNVNDGKRFVMFCPIWLAVNVVFALSTRQWELKRHFIAQYVVEPISYLACASLVLYLAQKERKRAIEKVDILKKKKHLGKVGTILASTIPTLAMWISEGTGCAIRHSQYFYHYETNEEFTIETIAALNCFMD